MDDNVLDNDEISDGLRGIVLAEPPLGFAPDDVATRAARRLRDRRVAMSTGLGVVAVAVAAVAFAANIPAAAPVATGPTARSGHSTAGSTAAVPRDHDLSAQATRNTAHLEQVLGHVLPHATGIKVGKFDQQYRDATDGEWESMTAEVMFRDEAGPAYFTLTVSGPQAVQSEPPASRCEAVHLDGSGGKTGKVADDGPRLPNGRQLKCKTVPQDDGSSVVVEETGALISAENPNVVALFGLDARHDRADGSQVNIVNDRLVSGRVADEYDVDEAGDRSRNPLTEQQLIALVTDSAFNVDYHA